MSQTSPVDRLREFLLGALSEADCEELELSLLSDDDLYELLLATEEELIDECVQGALGDGQKANFVRYLTTLPGGRGRLEFASALQATLARPKLSEERRGFRFQALLRRPSWLSPGRFAWSAGALLLAVAAGFLLATLLGKYLDRPPSMVLTAGIVRGEGEMPRLTISAGEPLVGLKLDLGFHEYERYRAVLHDSESREVFSASQLTAEVTAEQILVGFTIPAQRLMTGDYYVSLEGMAGPGRSEPVSRYDFRVILR